MKTESLRTKIVRLARHKIATEKSRSAFHAAYREVWRMERVGNCVLAIGYGLGVKDADLLVSITRQLRREVTNGALEIAP